MALIKIAMEPSVEEFRVAAKDDPKLAAQALEGELKRFGNHMMGQGMPGLTRIEHSILKEYLGWKLTNTPETP
jgi:hypothetical protein